MEKEPKLDLLLPGWFTIRLDQFLLYHKVKVHLACQLLKQLKGEMLRHKLYSEDWDLICPASTLAFNTFRDWASTASLANLFHYLHYFFSNYPPCTENRASQQSAAKIKFSMFLALPFTNWNIFFWITNNKLQTPNPKMKVNTKDCQHTLEVIYPPKSLEHLQNLFFFFILSK